MFSTVPGTVPLARSTASHQSTDADEPAVNCVTAVVESYSTDNASYSFDYLGDQ